MSLAQILGIATIALPSLAAAQPSAVTVGDKALDLSGARACTYSSNGSIYERPAAIWSIQQSIVNGSLNITLFRLPQGGAMFNLLAFVDGKSHQVSTVSIGAQGRIRGSGSIRFLPASPGGSFIIDTTTATGVRIRGVLTCPRFSQPQENG